MMMSESPAADRRIETASRSGWTEWRESALTYAGYSYLIADGALAAHGLLNKRPDRAFTGLSWATGGLAAALYGQMPPEIRERQVAYDLADFLQNEGITIPAQSALHRRHLHDRTHLNTRAEQFLYRYPSQILNGIFLAGGMTLLRSGMRQKIPDPWEAASGILVSSGAAAGLLLPEKPADEPSQAATLSPQWFLDKPLRISATLYTLHDLALLKSALRERSNPGRQRAYQLKIASALSYLVGQGFLAFASKSSESVLFNDDQIGRLLDMTGDVLQRSGHADDTALIERLSEHLAARGDIAQDAPTLTQMFQDRLSPRTPSPRLYSPASAQHYAPATPSPHRSSA